MPAITWPTGTSGNPFPQEPFMGFTVSYPEDMHYTFETSAGKNMDRPRSTNPRKQFTTPIEFSGAQLETFRVWFMETLEKGTRSFEWKDFQTGEACTLRFVKSKFPKFELVVPAPNDILPPDDDDPLAVYQKRYTGTLTLERIA